MDSGARTIDDEWPTRPRRSRRWEWLLLAILLTATMLNYADRQALPVVAVRVKAELQLSNVILLSHSSCNRYEPPLEQLM